MAFPAGLLLVAIAANNLLLASGASISSASVSGLATTGRQQKLAQQEQLRRRILLGGDGGDANLNTMEVLLKMYDETEGLQWTDHTNWFTSSDVCDWYGITCYEQGGGDEAERVGHVRKIDLAENRVRGTLPESVWDLPFLEVLNLRDNPDVDVTFKNIGNAKYLSNLIVSNTAVTSLDGIGSASSSFEEIHVTDCNFGSDLPDEIYDLVNLKQLYFNYAGFTGTLSSKVGKLASLTHLYLYENDLTGTIPPQIGNLANLKVLALSQNGFRGTVPNAINKLENLEILAIQRTSGRPKGEGLTGPLPALSNLRSVQEVYFENQHLSGTIPDNFLYYAPKQDGVKVNLMNNDLTGEVPAGLKDFDRLAIYLVGNKFTSIAPELCGRTNWMDGDVGKVQSGCSAILCPVGTSSAFGRATQDGGGCPPCASATSPYMGQTDCAGGIDGTTDQIKILKEFYAAMGGDSWNDRTGWADGGDDVCGWYGVECSSDGDVIALNLKNNGLTGTPPTSVFHLAQLVKLDLMANDIDFSFSGIGRAINLEYLWISNTGLKSTDGMEQLSKLPLRELRMSQNKMGGPIPKAVFNIQSLQYVSLSHNDHTGTLPSEVGLLTKLEELHLYGGYITGQIPPEIGNIGSSLKRLALSENEFTGTLPAGALNKLTNLEELSIHQTSRTGPGIGGSLPALTGMKQLLRLHLNSNSLKGPLPVDLLSGSNAANDEMSILLSDNQFTGAVPAAWTRFKQLTLDLSGNMITSIGSGLCGMGDWNEGAVSNYGCNGILCPVGSFNTNGKQAGSGGACQTCPSAQYMGSIECGAIADDPNVGGDQKILESIYYAASGAQWNDNDGWTTDADVCSWYGVSCDGNSNVISLDLSDNNLEGSIPSDIFKLSSLTELDLQSNDITFSFAGIENAAKLSTLYLSQTGLDSIEGIGMARSLKVFHSTNNKLSTIPYELYDVTSLEKLYLNYNNIGGRISGSIKKLYNLQELYLMHNQLTGQIPASIGGLNNIRVLGLTENNFDGTLPVELEGLRTMEVLAIQREGGTEGQSAGGSNVGTSFGSGKSGKGIAGPLLSFKDMPNLRELYLGSNSLTGTIPYDFLDGVEDKDSRQIIVDIVSNQLEGRVPSSLTQFDDLSIYLADNNFEGLSDGLCNKADWFRGAIGSYGCDGIMCPPNSFAPHGRQSSSDTACTQCPSGTNAPFYGSFECIDDLAIDSLKERDVLKAIYNALRGPQWTLSTNWLSDDVSLCQWHGVECVSEGTESVRGIRLPQNNLEGDVPSVIFELANIEEINLAGNEVVFSFEGIGQASSLQYLNVDNIGLKTLSGLENAPQLKLLHLVGNDFGGIFPEAIYSLKNLEVLYLSQNDIGGRLHSSMATLTNLVYLQCYECGLDQNIPTWLGGLPSLEYLRLDQNSLHGTIPVELEGLTRIQHIDLSDQISRGGPGLTGNLPRFANLLDMTELYLYKNNLSGDIPADFLFGEYKTAELQVDLRENKLTGGVSAGLAQLSKLSIYLAGNMLSTEIPPEICAMSFTRGYGCNGVMCPPGTYNELGRQTTKNNACRSCPDLASTQYYGSLQCGMNSQKEILTTFYSELNGANWNDNDGWDDVGASVCDYSGINCASGTDSVEGIVLENNNLVGTVPTDIFKLPDLMEIKLKGNDITFKYDGIEDAGNLVRLHLSDTGLTSIDGISKAQTLKYLHLTSNNLERIPDELYDLVNLEDLYLNYNGIQGTLSTRIGKLTNLKSLFLFHNKLSGEIPTQVGYLKNIETFALAENHMSGTIPTELTSLTKLSILALQREGGESAPGVGGPLEVKTAGEIGAGFSGSIPAFDKVPNLREVYLGANSLSGTIPRDFLSGIQDKSVTIKMDLSQNNLVGTVPESLAAFDSLKLYLSDNKIKALPESLCDQSNWMGGEVASNGCDAIMCPPGTYNEYGRQANDQTPCETCPYTYTAEFYGSIECIPSNTGDYSEREILHLFYQSTGGSKWSKSTNWLKDGISICMWYGITCASEEGGSGETVTKIELSSNKLSGTVPPAIYQLPNLKSVDVGNNKVGFEFRGIDMARVLDSLFLDRTKVTSLDGIGKASRLTTLHLQNNNFEGAPIPEDLYNLGNLESLYLSDSNLGGTLSPDIRKLDDLEEFYCHGNSLTGTLPPELGSLPNLKVLQLSENLFVGEIPREFDGLASLESLFIDSFTRNSVGLSGPVPDFNNLEYLTEINLNSNSLTGTIPDDFLINLKNKKARVVVGLQDNQVSGKLPQGLSRFSKLSIDVSGNMITRIDNSLCQLEDWQGGDVASYGCDAILCPPGTFNQYGRRSSDQFPCTPCEGAEQSPYMGSIMCESEEKKKEKEILELFYNTCGGKNWKNSDNWMSDDIDVCHWYGVSCKDGKTVDSILLGGNNVVGTPPAKLFQMSNLKWLWLYSNPINFKFDGIGSAKKLKSLLLDQTGLTSLRGIGAASTIEELDVRFNRLRGPLTREISQMVNLKDFAVEGNQLTGAIPSFSGMKKLERLRLGSNRFAGALDDFATNARLKSIDVSGNIMSGPIPSTLLKSTDSDEEIYLDLSSNNFIGEVPGELARFDKMTLYLRDNMITGINPALCENDGWNDGDVGEFSCDGLLCPAGTYSENYGRQTVGGQLAQCQRCEKANYFGASFCGVRSSATSERFSFAAFGVVTATVAILAVLII
eukprot:CAMPEP_0178558590 /NCGR_PEP_ID=MMETSP0697-20121206/10490_1 /TAXON_ID=265572 /ORGANISM="Extubocellulus spinifer, Strain CCMP396" /LENGTH=2669 /DNA_ID=CAMNT_0020191701 /DNA_START=259 /DNA_END=8268 /DNA_ORIENTATION=-